MSMVLAGGPGGMLEGPGTDHMGEAFDVRGLIIDGVRVRVWVEVSLTNGLRLGLDLANQVTFQSIA